MKLGRNDPCHCGSGKKYKRCHNDSDRGPRASTISEIEEYTDGRTVQMLLVRYQTPDFDQRVYRPATACREQFLQVIGDGLDGREAANALEEFMEALEQTMARIAGRHSRLYWLHLTRRLLPDPIGDSSEWTVQLYRRVLTLAALKHGAPGDADESTVIAIDGGGSSLVPGEVTADDVVDAYALEYLAFEYNAAASAYRRVCKGSKLVVIDEDFRAVASEEVQELIRLLDERVARDGTVGAQYGAALDDTFPEQVEGDDVPMVIFGLAPNVEQATNDDLLHVTGIRFTGGPNFAPTTLPVETYREVLIPFEEHLQAEIGSSPDALLATVWGLSLHLLRHLRNEPGLAKQIFTTGYLPSSKGEFLDGICLNVADFVTHWWSRVRGEEIEHVSALAVVKEALTALTYTAEDLANISLWDRAPFRLVVDVGDRVIFDLAAITMVMSGLFQAVGFDTPSAEGVKGEAFEDEVARLGQAAGFTLWAKSRRLKVDEHTEREIDAAFVVGNALVVVECKAYSQNKRVERGEFAAVKARWEKLHDDYLNQARSLKESLENNRIGRNYEIPSHVTRIEYCVCTPVAEWIPSREADLWLTETIPRICTPGELVEILGQIHAAPC